MNSWGESRLPSGHCPRGRGEADAVAQQIYADLNAKYGTDYKFKLKE